MWKTLLVLVLACYLHAACPGSTPLPGYTVTQLTSAGNCAGLTLGTTNTGGTSGTYTICYSVKIQVTPPLTNSDVKGLSDMVIGLCNTYSNYVETVYMRDINTGDCSPLSTSLYTTKYQYPTLDPNVCVAGAKVSMSSSIVQKNVEYIFCITVPQPLVAIGQVAYGYKAGTTSSASTISGLSCYTARTISGTITADACPSFNLGSLTATVQLYSGSVMAEELDNVALNNPWSFTNIPPGTYSVKIIPSDTTNFATPDQISVDVTAADATSVSASLVQVGSIHGSVLISPSTPATGWTVDVNCDNNVVQATVLNDGTFSVPSIKKSAVCSTTLNLHAGYTVQSPSNGVTQTGVSICSSVDYIVVPSGHSNCGDITVNKCTSVTSFSATVILKQNGNPIQTVTASNHYCFTGILDGSYEITVSTTTVPNVGFSLISLPVTVSGTDVTQDITLNQLGSISGLIYLDGSATSAPDGVFKTDGSDSPLGPDFPVRLTCSDQTYSTTVNTDSSGAFSLNNVPIGVSCTASITAPGLSLVSTLVSTDICTPLQLLVTVSGILTCTTGAGCCNMLSQGYYSHNCDLTTTPASVWASVYSYAVPTYFFGLPIDQCPNTCDVTAICSAANAIWGAGGGLDALKKQALTLEVNNARGLQFCYINPTIGNAIVKMLEYYSEAILSGAINASTSQIDALQQIIAAMFT